MCCTSRSLVFWKQETQAEAQLEQAKAALEGLVSLMANDADIRLLTRRIEALDRSLRRFSLITTQLEKTLGDLVQVLKQKQEEADE